MDDDILYWLWLSLAFSRKASGALAVLRTFGSPKAAYAADNAKLSLAAGERNIRIYSRETDEAGEILDWCKRYGIEIITLGSKLYPDKLRSITDPPMLLYCKGTMPDIDQRLSVAVVGTRSMTSYGKNAAYSISYDLAKAGAVVVSGMALGIDGIAHRAALDAKGRTVAVLGCGIDVIYPPENDALYKELSEYAAVITEYKPSAPPEKFHFPQRNRIISGLSDCTLVIEADTKSGALITAKDASTQGRDIAALPGNIGESGSKGTNMLIKEGAKPVTRAADITADYVQLYPHTLDEKKMAHFQNAPDIIKPFKTKISLPRGEDAVPPSRPKKQTVKHEKPIRAAAFKGSVEEEAAAAKKPSQSAAEAPAVKNSVQSANENAPAKKSPVTITPTEKRVYDALPDDKEVNADYLTEAGISVSEILVALTMLEIKGLIKALPGAMYKKL